MSTDNGAGEKGSHGRKAEIVEVFTDAFGEMIAADPDAFPSTRGSSPTRQPAGR